MQIPSKYLFASLWPVEVLSQKMKQKNPPGPLARLPSAMTKKLNAILRSLHKNGFNNDLIQQAKAVLESHATSNQEQIFRPIFYLLFFGYLDEDRLADVDQLVQQYRPWLDINPADWAYVQLVVEYYRQNWLTALHFADQFCKHSQAEDYLSQIQTNPFGQIYPCDAWIKGYLAAVFLRKPRKAIDFLERFSEDPAFHQESALRILKEIKDLSYLFVSLYLRKIWQRFSNEHFVLQIFKIIPVDQLHQHEKEFLAELLLPNIQEKPTLEGGKILLHLERYKEASEILPQIRGHHSIIAEAKFLAAQAFLEIGQFEKAKIVLEELQQIDPTHTEAHILMEILNPMVGEVQEVSSKLHEEEEELLASAIYACIRYLQSNQEELAIFLFKNILFTMEPQMNESAFNMDKLKTYIEMMERRANKSSFSKLLKQLQLLKNALHEKHIIDLHHL
ncbi:MAG: tetratricopeptide repeat protein [candidate division KSB1 bacterium]|nr:tetratricopeptide repeat protein [candidate division KSB1 bacterium]